MSNFLGGGIALVNIKSNSNSKSDKSIFESLWGEMYLDHKYKSFNNILNKNFDIKMDELINSQNTVLKKKIGLENNSKKTIYNELIFYFEKMLEIKWILLGRYQYGIIEAKLFLDEIENLQHREISMVVFLFSKLGSKENINYTQRGFIVDFTKETIRKKNLKVFFYFNLLVSMVNQDRKLSNVFNNLDNRIFKILKEHIEEQKEKNNNINDIPLNEYNLYIVMIEQVATMKCFFQKFKLNNIINNFMSELYKDYSKHIKKQYSDLPIFDLSREYWNLIKLKNKNNLSVNNKTTISRNSYKLFESLSNIYNNSVSKLSEQSNNIVLLSVHNYISWIFFTFYPDISKEEYVERVFMSKNKNKATSAPIIYYLLQIQHLMNNSQNVNIKHQTNMYKNNNHFESLELKTTINLLNQFVLKSVPFFYKLGEIFRQKILLFYFYQIRPESLEKRKFLSIVPEEVLKITKKNITEKGFFSIFKKKKINKNNKNNINIDVQRDILNYWKQVMLKGI